MIKSKEKKTKVLYKIKLHELLNFASNFIKGILAQISYKKTWKFVIFFLDIIKNNLNWESKKIRKSKIGVMIK